MPLADRPGSGGQRSWGGVTASTGKTGMAGWRKSRSKHGTTMCRHANSGFVRRQPVVDESAGSCVLQRRLWMISKEGSSGDAG